MTNKGDFMGGKGSGRQTKASRKRKAEGAAKVDLTKKTYEYLHNNFHKFSDAEKIRIALEIQKKAMATQLNVNTEFSFADMVKVAHEENLRDGDLKQRN